MALTTTAAASLLRPEEVHALITQPVTVESVAAQASTVVFTNSTEYRIPVLTGDPSAAWVNELEEIPISDAALGELDVLPRKVSTLSLISNELMEDSSPEASAVVGQRLVQALVRKIDQAWFANTTPKGPSGLGSIAPANVYGGAAYANLDAFLEAIAKAELEGAKLNSFVTHPNTALALAKVKKGTGSNEALLQPDPTVPTGRVIAGVPVLVSPDAPDTGVLYGVPKDRSFVVIRRNTKVDIDGGGVYFSKDAQAVRVTARVGFGFPHPAAIVKVNKSVAP